MFVLKGMGNALHGVADGAGKLVPGKRNKGDKGAQPVPKSPFESNQPQLTDGEQTHFPAIHSGLSQLSNLSGGECSVSVSL